MDHGRFLVARFSVNEVPQSWAWLPSDDSPLEDRDPIDFLADGDAEAIYALYKTEYSKLDEKLNVQMPEALLDYNRWLLLLDETDGLVAFVGFKTTEAGVKLCVLATNGTPQAKRAIKEVARGVLQTDGVFAEVSGGLERVLAGHVAEVTFSDAEKILGKTLQRMSDGNHYQREITNVGLRTKLLVGKPLSPH